MNQAKAHAREREEAQGPDEPEDPMMLAVERFARAKARKEAVEETAGGGLNVPRLTTWQKVKGECYQRCVEEYEAAKEALEEQFQKEVDRRKESGGENGEDDSESWTDRVDTTL